MKKRAGIAGVILALVFLILGFCSNAPDKYIKYYGEGKMYEYVGGDAYNFIIEASLRGGEISGAITAKAIYFGVAGILFIISLSFLGADNKGEDKAHGIVNSIPVNASVPSEEEEKNEDVETEPVGEQTEPDPEELDDETVEDEEEQPQV